VTSHRSLPERSSTVLFEGLVIAAEVLGQSIGHSLVHIYADAGQLLFGSDENGLCTRLSRLADCSSGIGDSRVGLRRLG
jgi:hypothetical protein